MDKCIVTFGWYCICIVLLRYIYACCHWFGSVVTRTHPIGFYRRTVHHLSSTVASSRAARRRNMRRRRRRRRRVTAVRHQRQQCFSHTATRHRNTATSSESLVLSGVCPDCLNHICTKCHESCRLNGVNM